MRVLSVPARAHSAITRTPEVDAATAQILARMLKDEPDERFENTAAPVQALILAQGHAASPLPAAAVAAAAPPAANISRPTPSAQITAQRPLQRRSAWLWKALALAFLALLAGFAALQWQGSKSNPADSAVAPDPESAALAPTAAAAPSPKVDLMHREAWAKYLLGHYLLKSWGAEEDVWTLDLLKQDAGLLSAELKGPEQRTIALSGRVESQSAQTMDGEDWDVYRLRLTGDDARVMQIRIEFSEDETGGAGVYEHAGQRLRFDVKDSEDL